MALATSGPEGGYGKIIRVDLLHKLHDELKLRQPGSAHVRASLEDCDDARAFFASTHAETHRQTTRDRI
jgi:riboflavin kinase/FMN adenylyltransferase